MTDLQVITTNPKDNKEIYKSLFKNKTLMLLWSGKFISIIGDSFFDIAVMWVVYAQSQSVLQSALVGVAFHLSTVLMSPIAGVVTDRLDRKTIMWSSNLLAALIVGITAIVYSILGYLPLLVAIISILLLNAMTTFINPAEASVMPEIVGKEHLVKANGIFSAIGQIGTLIGQAAAGITIALIGAGWALTWDAISFVLVAFCIFLASIPKRTNVTKEAPKKDKSFWVDLKTGWNYISKVPVLKGIIVLTLLINFSSFMGALYPALVNQQLNSSAGTYSLVMMSAVIGSMIGGVFIGFLESYFKAGHLLTLAMIYAGICVLGIAYSTLTIVTMLLLCLQTASTSIAAIILMTAQINLTENEFRGRVYGILQSFGVLAMPISTLLAGIIGEFVDVSVLFMFAGFWVLLISAFAWFNPI